MQPGLFALIRDSPTVYNGGNTGLKRVKLTVAYDGTNYCGWQVQPNGITIESELNRHLSELLGEEIRVTGASRTDAGVHALGNVAVFDTQNRMPAEKISLALNTRLPEDIRIQESREVAADFHPRFCNTVKTYEYRICNRRFPDPCSRLYSLFYYWELDEKKMQEGANYLVGTHDFTSFCTNKPEYRDRVRTIYSLQVRRDGDMLTVRIRGNGFLYNMVRIIVGTLLQVGSGKIAPEEIAAILEARDRGHAGDTARPQGLTLVKIEYPDEPDQEIS
jgi:tRNA pseudouridine38-40 synthase